VNRWRPVLVSITISKDCPQNGHAMVPDISTPNGNPVSAQRKPALAHRLLISHFLPGFLRCGHPKNTFAAMKDIPQMACRGEHFRDDDAPDRSRSHNGFSGVDSGSHERFQHR